MQGLVGNQAPFFKLKAVKGDGSSFIEVKLDDYKGKWLVIFYYPLDFTFVCPTEITGFSKKYEEFQKMNTEVLAVSCDSEYSHQAWIKSGLGEIKFPIAADKTMKVSNEYGILIEDEGISLRGLYIIDPEGIVRYSVVHDLNVGRSVEETLRVLKALQTGGLCPMGWKEGENTL
jgi:peroxiredoxin 2/4